MAAPDPSYDLLALLPAGLLATRERMDALAAAYASNGFQPLTGDQVTAAVGAAVLFPAGLPRLPGEGRACNG